MRAVAMLRTIREPLAARRAVTPCNARHAIIPSVRTVAHGQWSRGRSARVAASAGPAPAGAPEVKIAIEGMMCDGCSSRIEKVLKGMDAVAEVKVSLEGKSATIRLAKPEDAAAAAALVDTINSIGFEAKLSQ